MFFLFLSLGFAQGRSDLDKFVESKSLNKDAPSIASFVMKDSYLVLNFGDLEPKNLKVIEIAEFDSNGNETKACNETGNDTGCDLSVYNEQGLLILSKKRTGESEEIIYDDSNRIAQSNKIYSSGTIVNDSYTYNQNGDILIHQQNNRRIVYTYDEEYRLIEYREGFSGEITRIEKTEYTEDASTKNIYDRPLDTLDFVIKSRTDAEGNPIDTRHFRSDGTLFKSERFSRSGEVEEVTFFPTDGSKKVELFNPITGKYTGSQEYFSNGEIDFESNCEFTRAGNLKECWSQDHDRGYYYVKEYDSQGNEISDSTYIDDGTKRTLTSQVKNDYRYDHRGNILRHTVSGDLDIMESLIGDIIGDSPKNVYTYDENGNMTEHRGLDLQDNLKSIKRCAYTYDKYQNIKTRTCSPYVFDGGEWVVDVDRSYIHVFDITYYQ